MDKFFGLKTLPQDSPAIPLLEKNDTGSGVYISHIDRSSLWLKKAVFAVALLNYTVFSVIMVWRASKNYHVVLALVLNDLYYVETGVSKSVKNGFWSSCWMFMVASFDYYLLSTLWPHVRAFIAGRLWFRLCYGFHEAEIVFRVPIGKRYDDMLRLPPAKFQQVWRMSLLQATDRQLILRNIGVNTRCPHWELCDPASMDAYRLANDGVFDLKNWELSLWQKDEYQRWTVLQLWRHQDPSLNAMAHVIMKENLRAEGKEGFIPMLEAILAERVANIGLAPLSINPAKQELVQDINALLTAEEPNFGERWSEAMAEADRIRNQSLQQQ